MRFSLVAFVFLAFVTTTNAQEQERKLVDRLLSPDSKLANSQQNKKFMGGREASTRTASTRSFYLTEKNRGKTFAADRRVATTSFSANEYTAKGANVPTLPQPIPTFSTKKARGVSPVTDSTKKYATRDYSGNRPFLGQGKSQKSLHAQDRPLTIDEVRELLNKNK